MRRTFNGRSMVRLVLACGSILVPIAAAADAGLDRYAAPEQLVAIAGGHRLNLRCSGQGSRTVLLEAGAASDSSTWFKLLPLVAKTATVCSYDRAGYGYSDEGALPRDLAADVRDLGQLIDAAALRVPLVLVGHSLGTRIAREYATLNPTKVGALVLLDPPAQDIAEGAPQWALQEDAATTRRDAMLKACEAGAEAGALAVPEPALQGCLREPDPAFDVRVNAALRANKLRPAFWHTLVSELGANVALFKQQVPSAGSLGALPMIVMVATDTYADAPPADRRLLESARSRTVERILALSTRSHRIDVAHSSHDVQLDQAGRVADALAQAIAMTPATPATKPERHSAADVQHGPTTPVDRDFPVLSLARDDDSLASTPGIAMTFRARGARVGMAGAHGGLGVVAVRDGACTPLVAAHRFCSAANALALRRGRDPDRPPHLHQATETFRW